MLQKSSFFFLVEVLFLVFLDVVFFALLFVLVLVLLPFLVEELRFFLPLLEVSSKLGTLIAGTSKGLFSFGLPLFGIKRLYNFLSILSLFNSVSVAFPASYFVWQVGHKGITAPSLPPFECARICACSNLPTLFSLLPHMRHLFPYILFIVSHSVFVSLFLVLFFYQLEGHNLDQTPCLSPIVISSFFSSLYPFLSSHLPVLFSRLYLLRSWTLLVLPLVFVSYRHPSKTF